MSMDILFATQQSYTNPYSPDMSKSYQDTNIDDQDFQDIVKSYDDQPDDSIKDTEQSAKHDDTQESTATEGADSTAEEAHQDAQNTIDEINYVLQSLLGSNTDLTFEDIEGAVNDATGETSDFWSNLLSLLQSDSTISITSSEGDTKDVGTLESLFSSLLQQNGSENSDLLGAIKQLLTSDNTADVILSNLTPEQRSEALDAINNIIAGQATDEDFEILNSLTEQIAAYIVQQPTQQTAPLNTSLGHNLAAAANVNNTERNQQQNTQQPLGSPSAADTQAGTQGNNNLNGNAAQNKNTAQPATQNTGNSDSNLQGQNLTTQNQTPADAGQVENAPTAGSTRDPRSSTNRSFGTQDVQGTGYTRNSEVAQNGNGLPIQSATTNSESIESPLLQQDTITALGQSASQLQSTTSTQALTQNLTQAAHATQAHPATQMVSATLTRAANAGQSTEIKLMLDPPELGRVEVKMSIDGDNTQIVLTAEKPETYMMLRRDADTLQRALQGTGLEGQADISFEMSQDNSQFAGRNAQDQFGSNTSQAGNNDGRSAEGDGNIIETTMDWHIDPQTGTMHYNVLV